jgi:hypothetical protein
MFPAVRWSARQRLATPKTGAATLDSLKYRLKLRLNLSHHFLPGDHLRIWRPTGYAHDVICLDERRVIHYWSDTGRKRDARVRVDEIHRVVQADAVEIVQYGMCFPPKVVVELALGREGEQLYNGAFKNCQGFARWCKTGDESSDQVRQLATTTGGLGGGLGATAITLEGVGLLGVVPGKSAAGIMSALRSAGSAVGGGAGAGILVFAFIPAGVAIATIRLGFADDPYATDEKRSALRAARLAGALGAVGGTGISAILVSLAGSGAGAIKLTTALKALGAGRMIGGLTLAFGLPLVTAGAAAFGAYWFFRRRARTAQLTAGPST